MKVKKQVYEIWYNSAEPHMVKEIDKKEYEKMKVFLSSTLEFKVGLASKIS